MLRIFPGMTSLTSNSKPCNFINSWEMIKRQQSFSKVFSPWNNKENAKEQAKTFASVSY